MEKQSTLVFFIFFVSCQKADEEYDGKISHWTSYPTRSSRGLAGRLSSLNHNHNQLTSSSRGANGRLRTATEIPGVTPDSTSARVVLALVD